MLDDTHEHGPAESAERRRAHHLVTVVLRTGALLLGSGASTNDVETTMRTLEVAAGLPSMEPTVIAGLVTVSWDPGLHGEPITMIRVVRQRSTEYDRLVALASIVRRVQSDSL